MSTRMDDERVRVAIDELVRDAPPLGERQRDTLRLLFRSGLVLA